MNLNIIFFLKQNVYLIRIVLGFNLLGRIFDSFCFFFVCIRFSKIFGMKTNTDTFLLSVFGFPNTNNKFRRILRFSKHKITKMKILISSHQLILKLH